MKCFSGFDHILKDFNQRLGDFGPYLRKAASDELLFRSERLKSQVHEFVDKIGNPQDGYHHGGAFDGLARYPLLALQVGDSGAELLDFVHASEFVRNRGAHGGRWSKTGSETVLWVETSIPNRRKRKLYDTDNATM